MAMDLNYYILPFTHEIKLFDDKSKKKFIDRGYFVCPDIIETESDLITKLSDSDFEEKTHAKADHSSSSETFRASYIPSFKSNPAIYNPLRFFNNLIISSGSSNNASASVS